MSQQKKVQNFIENVLEKASKEDELFRDNGPALGQDPFVLNDKNEREETSAPSMPLVNENEFLLISKKHDALQALFKFVNKNCSFQELIQEILSVFLNTIHAEVGSFLEMDYKNNCLFFRAVSNQSAESLMKLTIPKGAGVVGFVAESQQTMLIANLKENAMYLKAVQNSTGFDAHNLAAVPIVIRGRTFGVVELFNKIGDHQFTLEDEEILLTIAQYAARVIENRLVLASLTKMKQEAA